MITKKEVQRYRNIIENGTATQAINTMIGLHTRICAIMREVTKTNDWTFAQNQIATQIKDLWEDLLMNADYNDFDILDENEESFLIQTGIKLAVSELIIIGFKCNEAYEFLQYDSTLSIRLF